MFEEIENEEKTRVSTLFSDESKASEYFREITNNLYKKVRLKHRFSMRNALAKPFHRLISPSKAIL
jgi:hypothetical protein